MAKKGKIQKRSGKKKVCFNIEQIQNGKALNRFIDDCILRRHKR